MGFTPVKAREIFCEYPDQLLDQALLGSGELLSSVCEEFLLSQKYLDLSRGDEVLGVIRNDMSLLLATVPPFHFSDLMRFRGRRIPCVQEPQYFNSRLAGSAVEMILESSVLAPVRGAVVEILSDLIRSSETGRIKNSSFWKRSLTEEGGPDRYQNFYEISHELGRCLFQRGLVCVAVNDEYAAQTFMYQFEGEMMNDLLKSTQFDQISEFRKYQRRIDALNFAYLGIEYGDLNPWRSALRKSVQPELDVFREEIFTDPGRHLDYSVASLRRLSTLLGKDEPAWRWNV